MSLKHALRNHTPEPLKKVLRPIRNLFVKKYESELAFWRSRLEIDNGTFNNSFYEELMLGMADEESNAFLEGKVVADFGCGPRGTLVWATPASLRIGIDVLVDAYADEFADNLISHGMIYLKSTEKVIPLPSDFVDVMFTLNAIDHVDQFSSMCDEILRVLKPGGEFIGSFNLEEHATPCEPQRLNEQIIKENLLDQLEITNYRVTKKGPKENIYEPFSTGDLSYEVGEEGILWVRATKPA